MHALLASTSLAAAGLSQSALAASATAIAGADGSIAIKTPGGALHLAPIVMAHNWGTMQSHAKQDSGDRLEFRIQIDEDNLLNGRLHASAAANGAIDLRHDFVSDAALSVNVVCLAASFRVDNFAGGTWQTDNESGTFPVGKSAEPHLHSSMTTNLTIRMPGSNGAFFAFHFPHPTRILLQDNREWNVDSYTLRISPAYNTPLARGDEFSLPLSLRTAMPLSLAIDRPVTITASEKKWIPLRQSMDIKPGSPLDFSQIVDWHAPAGKHGRVVSVDGHFEFEKLPGVKQRFYGNNLCFSANYVSAGEAKTLAERFRRIGYNTVRLHHHDNTLVEGDPDKTRLNAERLDQLDRLVAAFIENGVYVTTDLFVSRAIPWRAIGVDEDGDIPMNEFKLLCAVEPRAMENWKTFTRQFMLHKNPYTGRTYAEEPGFAWISFINEGNPGNFSNIHKRTPQYVAKWTEWLAAKRAADPACNAIPDAVPEHIYRDGAHVAVYLQFLRDVEAAMSAEMKRFLREALGCKALLTNMNGWTQHACDQVTRADIYDYVDDHFYVDHPRFLEKSWRLPSASPNENPFMNAEMGMRPSAFSRIAGMPFTISEYNFSGPGRFRGVGGIAIGAIGALQDWSALWRFAYSHQRENMFRPTQIGYFDIANDPLALASERAAVCMFLRGDVEPLQKTITLVIPRADVMNFTEKMPRVAPGWVDVGWRAKVQTALDSAPADSTWQVPYDKAYQAEGAKLARAAVANEPFGGGAFDVDKIVGTFKINTPRTVGLFAEGGRFTVGILEAEIAEAPATLWVSSLDGLPCTTSRRLLLTHLTDVQNTNIRYGELARRTLLAWGGLPHLAERGVAHVALSAENPEEFSVYALDVSGARTRRIKTDVKDGRLVFTVDTAIVQDDATLAYELTRSTLDLGL
ncbi:MAG: hypothetical protein ACOX9C_02265 [Kiritimatiellia bacterium]